MCYLCLGPPGESLAWDGSVCPAECAGPNKCGWRKLMLAVSLRLYFVRRFRVNVLLL